MGVGGIRAGGDAVSADAEAISAGEGVSAVYVGRSSVVERNGVVLAAPVAFVALVCGVVPSSVERDAPSDGATTLNGPLS